MIGSKHGRLHDGEAAIKRHQKASMHSMKRKKTKGSVVQGRNAASAAQTQGRALGFIHTPSVEASPLAPASVLRSLRHQASQSQNLTDDPEALEATGKRS